MDKARASVVSLLRRDAVGGAGRGNLDAAIVEVRGGRSEANLLYSLRIVSLPKIVDFWICDLKKSTSNSPNFRR